VTGVVKFFSAPKGFGFLYADHDGSEVYVGARALPLGMILREGDRVSYAVQATPKGPRAVDVRILETASPLQQEE